MTITRHFSVQEWTDFARGLGDEAHRSAMHQHLSTGCAACGEFVATLQRFAPIVANEAQYEPPAEVVVRAEAVFQPRASNAVSRARAAARVAS